MKYIFLLLFFTTSFFAQTANDSLSKKETTKELFSDDDLKLIDSLLIGNKFNSSLAKKNNFNLIEEDSLDLVDLILTSDLLKERLNKLNSKTPFFIAYNLALEKEIKYSLKYRKKIFPILIARAKYYFPMFEKYLDAYNIPLEMKYLAIVESALVPTIKSRAGASGLWQFMYGTGIQYDLKVTSYVDDRHDPIKSTIAACKYLSKLYDIFGDWNLALAAYNSGPGNVLKAIKRSGGNKNYWNLRPYLPKETASYVPAFYAMIYLFEYKNEHQLVSSEPEIRFFETDTIHIKKTISFDHISEITGIKKEIIAFLNPSYKLDIIPYDETKNYTLTLPRKSSLYFLEKEQEIYALADNQYSIREKPMPETFETDKAIRHKVKNGEFLGKIASKYGVRISEIKKWNSLRSDNIDIGQRLMIYPKNYQSTIKEEKTKIADNTNESKSFDIYVVKEGDSFWSISQKYKDTSAEKIQKWNNIWSATSLKPGMKLKIFKG
jgi:membrane-bound lytic murein transglycosylase D